MILSASVLTVLAIPASAQPSAYPPISAREFVGGSVKVKVTGTFAVDQEIQINTKASISDGDMTWLQYGASGSADGDALITFTQTKEVGIMVGTGKQTATAGVTPGEQSLCTGKTEVAAKLISGHYTCKGVTSYEPKTFKMGKVDIDVTFTAKS
jgi:hypothetical protein